MTPTHTSRTCRWFPAVAALTLVAILLIGGMGRPALAAARNVVLLIGDDHGLQVGCYGDTVIQTPGMDRLARQGTRFAQAFAAVSSCSPSRSTILTGMFIHTTGQYGLAHAKHNFHSFANLKSLPALLKQAGYRTAIVGKYHVNPPEIYPFDEQLPAPGGPRQVTRMAESAKKFMAADSDRPFFLLVGYTDPHRAGQGFANEPDYPGVKTIKYDPQAIVVPPWLPDTPEVRADLAGYYESTSRMDQGINQMLDAITATGHQDDTLVIYVSDNGPPFPGAKSSLYEPGIHLPLIISSPDQKKRGVVNQALVSLVDLAPTIMDWAGVKPPKQVFGRSVLPLLDQDNPAGWDRVFGSHIFHEITMYYPMRMLRTRQYKYILNLAHPLEYPLASDLWNSPTWQGVLKRGDTRYGQRTIQALLHHPREELYDLTADPHEVHNLADDPALQATLQELRDQLKQWQEQTDDPWILKHARE